MATREELYTALRNADAAGDDEGAAKLAAYIQSLPAEPPPPPAASVAASPAEQRPPDWPARANDIGSSVLKNAQGALAEPVAQVASGMLATPVAGLAGLAQGAKNLIPGMEGMPAADRVRQVENAMTYEPRTTAGKAVSGVVQYPFAKLGQFGDWAGQKASNATGSPAVGAGVNTAIQFLPAALLKMRGARGASAAESRASGPRIEPTITEPPGVAAANAAPPAAAIPPNVAAAQNYVASRTSLDWNALSDSVKTRLADIAKDAKSLDKLDPAAVERQARLESLPVPVTATRGQLTRNPVQLRNEGNVSATDAGKPIRDTYQQQTRQLLDNLDILKGKVRGTGKSASTAETPEQVGTSVQDAARAKLKEQQDKVKSLYKLAEAKGELQGSAPTRSLAKLIEETPDLQHLGWVESWLNKADIVTDQKGAAMKGMRMKASLKELEDLRQAAVARAMDGGTEGYYAGKVIGAIDQATEGVGGSAYKSARAARKAQAMEFEEQAGVARLVDNKSRTDRAVALEDTWRKTVLGGSIEDLKNVKRSLLTGNATRTAGRKAWRDLRAQTVQHIRDEATKSVTRYEDGTPNVTPASMERAIKSIGPDKLEEIFGQGTVRQLNQIMEATRDIKTEPPTGFKGSPTFANMLAFLEKGISKVPVLGDTVTGAVRGISKLREIGAAGREVRQAQKTPLAEGIESMTAAQRRARIADQLRTSAKSSAPFSTVPQQAP